MLTLCAKPAIHRTTPRGGGHIALTLRVMTEDNAALSPEPPIAIPLEDDAATARIGAALGRALRIGDAVLLTGGLGAGKTALARAAIGARLADRGVVEDIPSPTFTLVQTYEADIPIWHADLYRLSSEDEVYELGLDEAFETAAVLIEWPERLGFTAPQRALAVELEFGPKGEGRIAVFQPRGLGWAPVIDALKDAI